jgi:hypothetical protein
MVSIPLLRSHDTLFLDYYESIIMTSNEYIAPLDHKQERREKVMREKEKRKANLENTKNRKAKEKIQMGKGKG